MEKSWEIDRAKVVLETDTGEILSNFNEGDRILRKESADYYRSFKRKQRKELEEYQDWKIDNFYKGNIEELRKNMQKLDVYEKAFLFSVVPYTGYEDCCLKYPENGKELKFDTLVKISGISKGKLSQVINSLVEKDILYKGKNSNMTQYFVNPWLFCKGNRINKVLKTMFKNYKIEIKNGKEWKELEE